MGIRLRSHMFVAKSLSFVHFQNLQKVELEVTNYSERKFQGSSVSKKWHNTAADFSQLYSENQAQNTELKI